MIRNVETMNFADIERAINDLGEKVNSFHLDNCIGFNKNKNLDRVGSPVGLQCIVSK